jgi:hypothetical protein
MMVGVGGVAVSDGCVAVDRKASVAGEVVAVAGVAVLGWDAGGARLSAKIVVSMSMIARSSFLFLATITTRNLP